jgi:hypothetical protein
MSQRTRGEARRIAMVLVVATVTALVAVAGRRATTAVPPPLDHFSCYSSRDASVPRFAGRNVTLVDEFGSTTAFVSKPSRLCLPVDESGEGVNDPTAHLMCYRIREVRRCAASSCTTSSATKGST